MGKLTAAIVNPADKYKEKGEALHKYGQYLMSCLPKYVQQCVAPGPLEALSDIADSRSGKTN
jgi:hypothetical protein